MTSPVQARPFPSNSSAPLQPGDGARRSGRQRCFFSIDFEDYAHDFQRALGVVRPRHDRQSLLKAYARIEAFAKHRLDGARITFFTTGQVARDYPEVVRRIAGDGHEIACHYYEHDQIWHQDRQTFRENLERAVECLSQASGSTIKGFRAPDFSIDERCADWVFEELSRYFLYDSSRVTEAHHGRPGEPEVMMCAGRRLYELPVFRRSIMRGLELRVIGGTYARLLPTGAVIALLREAARAGFIPQVYFHPYDLLQDYEQWSGFDELSDLPMFRRLYWWLRQTQWHAVGNAGVFGKLGRIFEEFEHPGPIEELFADTRPQMQSLHVVHANESMQGA